MVRSTCDGGMQAERTELFQDLTLCFDEPLLVRDVAVGVDVYWLGRESLALLFEVHEYGEHITHFPRTLLHLCRQEESAHGIVTHIKLPHGALGVEAVERDLRGGDSDLRQAQQDTHSLDELTSEDTLPRDDARLVRHEQKGCLCWKRERWDTRYRRYNVHKVR